MLVLVRVQVCFLYNRVCTFARAELGLRGPGGVTLFAHARTWCCGRAAHVTWCVPVYGVKKSVLVIFGQCVAHPLYCGVSIVYLVGSSVYSVPVLRLGMVLWTVVSRGVLVSVGPCIAYPFDVDGSVLVLLLLYSA